MTQETCVSMFCVSELNRDTIVPHSICYALVTWATELAVDSLISIFNLTLSFHGQGCVPSYKSGCCD